MFPKHLLTFTFLFFLLQFSWSWGQNTVQTDYKDTPLKTVLTDIEQQTGLLFSYSDEVIANKTITLIKKSVGIDQLLALLTKKTRLIFEKLGADQVIVSAPKPLDTVCGYLFDIITKEPLPYATIVIKGTSKGFISDENGYFNIEDEAITNGILVQYIGYASRVLAVTDFAQNECKNFFLNPKAESLSEVVILSYLIQGIDKNIDGSITLTSNEMGVLPGLVAPDVFQSAQWVPGITSINETVSDIQIRGGSADQNLILYDGIKMYNTGHFFGMLSIFNPYTTTKATIFKGGANPNYGDRISGVIDILGETEVPQKTSLGVGVNGTHADAFLKTSLGEKFGVVASARRSYADLNGLATPTFNAISDKVFQNTKVVSNATGEVLEEDGEEETLEGDDQFYFFDTNVKLIYKPTEKDSLYISGLYTYNDLNFELSDDENRSQDILTSENQGLSFNWSGQPTQKISHSLKGYYSMYESFYRNQTTENGNIEEQNLRRNSVEDYGAEVRLGYDFSRNHSIETGYQYSSNEVFYQLFRDALGGGDIDPEDPDIDEEDETEPDDTDGSDGEDSEPQDGSGQPTGSPATPVLVRDFNEKTLTRNITHALYGAYHFRPNNRGLVTVGLRLSKYSLLKDWFLEPRINVEYPLGRSLRLKLTGEKRYQAISQLVEFEDTQIRLQNGVWTLTDNDDFPILESNQFSTGLLFDHKGWTIDLDGYYKKIDGLTTFTNGFTNAAEEYSQGESTILGVDFLLKKHVGSYRIWLGYTFNTIEYSFNNLQQTPFPGNNDITHNVTISNTFEHKNWHFSLGWNYRSGAPYTPAAGLGTQAEEIVFGSINSLRLPAYHRLDASVLYSFKLSRQKTSQGSIGLSCQNLYNRQVPLSVFYRVDENPDTGINDIERLEQLSLGFAPNFLVRFNF